MNIRNLIALLIIVALGFGGFFLKDYFNQASEADAIVAQIKNTNQTVSTVSGQTKSLESEMADLGKRANEIQMAINTEDRKIPARFNSNEAVKSILLMGQMRELKVIPLSTQDWTPVKIDKHTYQVFKMTAEVIGLQERLVDFVKELQGSLYETLVIENLSITKPVPTPTPTSQFVDEMATPTPTPTVIEDTGMVKGKVQIAIYAK
jgi:hypothetical protein